MKSDFQKRLNEALSYRNMRPVDLVNASGISKGRISQYMGGLYKPKTDSLIAIAKALNVNYRWLNGDDVPLSDFDQKVADTFSTFDEWDKKYNPNGELAVKVALYDAIVKQWGEQTAEAVDLYQQLDEGDKGEIRGEMKQMLKNNKYAIQKESLNG